MSTTFSYILFRLSIFNFLPLLLAGVAGLGAGLLFGSRSSKNPDDDEKKELFEEEQRNKEKIARIEEQKMQDAMLAAQKEQQRQNDLMQKRTLLESAIGKLDPIKLEESIEVKDESNVSELYSDKLDSDWMGAIINYFKKRRNIKNKAFE